MTQYNEISNEIGHTVIERISENGVVSYIPIEESNSDYQGYLRWLENPDAEEGGTL